MTQVFGAWKLSYECRPAKGESRHTNGSIVYSAESQADAIASGLRWMKGREAYADLFGAFMYFQISPYVIGPIDSNGSLHPGTGMRLMEWSRDRAGVDKETYCDWKIAEYQRKAGKGREMISTRICVSCLIDLPRGATTGQCTIYRSGDSHVLCEECFLDEDGEMFELAGTNNLPFLLDIYDQAWNRKRQGAAGKRPSQHYSDHVKGIGNAELFDGL